MDGQIHSEPGTTGLSNSDCRERVPSERYEVVTSPDGTRIVYYNRTGDNSDLYVMDAVGGQPYQLTSAPEQEQWPDWSPDGMRITYTSAVGMPEGQRTVFVLDLSGGEPLQLTHCNTEISVLRAMKSTPNMPFSHSVHSCTGCT